MNFSSGSATPEALVYSVSSLLVCINGDRIRKEMSVFAELNRRLEYLCSREDEKEEDIPVEVDCDVPIPDEEAEGYASSGAEDMLGKIQSEFNSWYIGMHSRSFAAPTLTTPRITKLDTHQSYKARNLRPYEDRGGKIFPLNHIREIIPSANRYLRACKSGKAFKTYFTTRLRAGTGRLPDGVHIYDFAIERELAENAMTEIVNLYQKQVHNRDPRILMINPNTHPTNTILFYSRDEEQPTFLDVMEILHTHTPKLAEYIMVYCKVIMGLFEIDKMQLETSQISLVRYDRKAGLNPHIDSIHQFGDTIGPIATIAIGTGEKMFDMLPTLLTDGSTPVRIYSQPNQITIMDGVSRVAWSHALPWGYDQEQFTVAIKFPALAAPKRHEDFVYQGVTTQVPYYI